MRTKTIDASDMRKNFSEALDVVRDNKNIILVKRRGKVESALINVDSLEDMLALQNPEYVKIIADARADKRTYTQDEVFVGLWDEA